MTRKFLGKDPKKTMDWLAECHNCDTCSIGVKDVVWAYSDLVYDLAWAALKRHIVNVHNDEEFCLTCHVWMEDVEFESHLWDKHKARWKQLNGNYKEV